MKLHNDRFERHSLRRRFAAPRLSGQVVARGTLWQVDSTLNRPVGLTVAVQMMPAGHNFARRLASETRPETLTAVRQTRIWKHC
jgi:hypothetical protein